MLCHVVLTVSLVVKLALALAVDVAVTTLAILIVALLLAILRVETLLLLLAAVVALLVLGHAVAAAVGLARLEGSCAGGESGRAGAELGASLVVAQAHLLGLVCQVLVLGGRVVFPRVEVRHGERRAAVCRIDRWSGLGGRLDAGQVEGMGICIKKKKKEG